MLVYEIRETKQLSKSFHLNETMVLLKWLLRIFSLDSSEKRLAKSEKFWYIFKCVVSTVIIGAVDSYALVWKLRYIFSTLNPSIILTDMIQMTYDYGQYIVDLFFIYKYGREISQEYFKNYDCIDKILDMTHKTEIKSKVLKLSTMFLLLWLIISIFDFTSWCIGYGLLTPVVYCLAYLFLLIKVLTNLDLTIQILNVACRLRVIGDFLQDCYNTADCLSVIASVKDISDSISNRNWFYGEGCTRAVAMKTKVYPLKNSSSNMRWLTRCYLLINEQCTFINSMFGVRILLNSLSLLIDMVRFLNVVVRLSIGSQKTEFESGYLPAISTFLRFLFCVAILFSLVYHCECAYAQTDRIISVIDHILINKDADEVLRSSLTELRGLVSSRPISFNMANFFKLSYSFLVSTISVVVTYTIILLQSI